MSAGCSGFKALRAALAPCDYAELRLNDRFLWRSSSVSGQRVRSELLVDGLLKTKLEAAMKPRAVYNGGEACPGRHRVRIELCSSRELAPLGTSLLSRGSAGQSACCLGAATRSTATFVSLISTAVRCC